MPARLVPQAAQKNSLAQLTFLRMGDLMFDQWDAFSNFILRMRRCGVGPVRGGALAGHAAPETCARCVSDVALSRRIPLERAKALAERQRASHHVN